MMKPKYKVGDIVTIKNVRQGTEYDYRFGFLDEMLEEGGGKSYKIRSIEESTAEARSIPDDGYLYKLDGIFCSWASSMFEDSSDNMSSFVTECSNDNSIDAFIKRNKRPELDFNL